MESINDDEIVRELWFSPDVRGLFRDGDGNLLFDRRLTSDAIERKGLSPRTADLNIIGAAIVNVSESLAEELGVSEGIRSRRVQPSLPNSIVIDYTLE